MATIAGRKRYSINSEVRALLTLAHDGKSGSQQAAGHLLSSLTADHFVTPVGEQVFRRIKHQLKSRGELPDVDDLFEDPGIESDTRLSLQAYYKNGARGLRNVDKARKLVQRLETFRKLRALFNIGANLESALSEDQVDPDGIIASLATSVTNASSSQRNMKVTSRGDGNTTLEVAKRILNGNGASFIPTGFKAFDNVNSGIPRGAFMLITTVTGGGKSSMISQMAENFANNGAQVGVVPLEMSTDEMVMRDIARAARVDMTDLLSPKQKMSIKARIKAFKRYKASTIDMDKRGGSVKIIEPGGDVDITTLLAECKPFDFDVLMIDYVGLLKGAEGDRQWQELGNITRYCKIWAGLNNCVVIMAAQLSAEGILRYSRGMEEHASYAWAWIPDELTETTGIVRVEQRKARQARQFDFLMHMNLAHMHLRDVTREEEANYNDARDNLKKKFKKDADAKGKRMGHNGGPKHDMKEQPDEDDEDDEPPKRTKGSHGKGKWSPTYGGGRSKGGRQTSRFEQEF